MEKDNEYYDMLAKMNKAAVKAMDDDLLRAQWIHAELAMRNNKCDDFVAMDMWCGTCEREMIERGMMTQDEILAIDEDDEFTGNEIAC